ncbi:MAG: hypothetical protein KZQ66_10155 [Candidatus Thiodiazotropha sp. (ex Lucinoma aequizonata)]|nr:hypothetical protein [Candidatus Thiodiazotropha sp. (ex Lucinoma aequizonata)]MCU7887525.1 hypothetical protein [Candidatus Thiodiazotropha sp. (ex Lucinoma aequizonata)]MCU7894383.1 hypothetical protein [Candidatus Thiodiazotropha sp. (ex Lucinoma aequizonata)]MCU7897686.1 hypothetical protein [Candidatus Thiodiazotropha sp. (ex Lucinoma aequizonata)]MCU7902305.1 hypothetical protein [Candidatus Thiodiazotropha sp. (ex Lucinoma aequizonata)]
MLEEARAIVTRLDQGRDVLVLTDMYGSTLSNIASDLAEKGRINVISGVNFPMLIHTLN